jgi:hypothetical protein
MAKASNNKEPLKTDKPAKESSSIFHNIMAASVKGNPKPKNKNEKKNDK